MGRIDVERLRAQLGALPRPKLMSIGDSLYNGMRSMTINASLAKLAPAALLAEAMEWPFVVPDYPRDVLFDLEALYRSPSELLTLLSDSVANARAWLNPVNGAWSRQMFFDNAAIAGLRIEQLDTPDLMSYGAQYPKIATLLTQIEASHTLPVDELAELHVAINGSFLLNPSRSDLLANATPIDLVVLRQPERVVIDIGPNNGFIDYVMSGGTDLQAKNDLSNIPQLMDELVATLLQRVAPVTPHIYLNLLPRPRSVAIVSPPGWPKQLPNPPCQGYYSTYMASFITSGQVTGEHLKSIDAEVATVNSRTRDIVTRRQGGANGPIQVVDVYQFTSDYDLKHGCDANEDEMRVTLPGSAADTLVLSNWPLSTLPFSHYFGRGGMFGLDTVHPTAVGYGLLARRVLDAMSVAEALHAKHPELLEPQATFPRDSLLSRLPPITDVGLVLTFIGRFAQAMAKLGKPPFVGS